MRIADLDAVTVDGMGTLVELEPPVTRLRDELAAVGILRDAGAVADAFAAEVAYYRPRSHRAGDAAALAALRHDCAGVFLDHLAADVDPVAFAPRFLGSLRFRPIAGVTRALEQLRSRELRVAVASNWDCSLPDTLASAGLRELVDAVVASADVGAPKPEPDVFRRALELLGVDPARALHVGDEADDEAGALAAGMRFAYAPLAGVVKGLL